MVFFFSLFVVMYVWQNIEVMKIKMNYRELVAREKETIKENDRLIYLIEQARNVKTVERIAENSGLRKIRPDNIEVIVVNGKK